MKESEVSKELQVIVEDFEHCIHPDIPELVIDSNQGILDATLH